MSPSVLVIVDQTSKGATLTPTIGDEYVTATGACPAPSACFGDQTLIHFQDILELLARSCVILSDSTSAKGVNFSARASAEYVCVAGDHAAKRESISRDARNHLKH